MRNWIPYAVAVALCAAIATPPAFPAELPVTEMLGPSQEDLEQWVDVGDRHVRRACPAGHPPAEVVQAWGISSPGNELNKFGRARTGGTDVLPCAGVVPGTAWMTTRNYNPTGGCHYYTWLAVGPLPSASAAADANAPVSGWVRYETKMKSC